MVNVAIKNGIGGREEALTAIRQLMLYHIRKKRRIKVGVADGSILVNSDGSMEWDASSILKTFT